MAYCGVLDEEQARRQPFEINAEVVADLGPAGQSDDLDDTINYGVLGDEIAQLIETGRFALLEYFAQQVADVLLADRRVIEATVEILKLRPPMAQRSSPEAPYSASRYSAVSLPVKPLAPQTMISNSRFSPDILDSSQR